jgi:hypothetical protein
MLQTPCGNFPEPKACRTREQLAELTASRGSYLSKFLSCFSRADSFREDLTSRGLEENIYRV